MKELFREALTPNYKCPEKHSGIIHGAPSISVRLGPPGISPYARYHSFLDLTSVSCRKKESCTLSPNIFPLPLPDHNRYIPCGDKKKKKKKNVDTHILFEQEDVTNFPRRKIWILFKNCRLVR